MASALTDHIEAAFHFRGDVTLVLRSGVSLVGYLFNRAPGDSVELLAADGERHRIAIAEIQSVACTGVDHAAGKSYQEWLAKKKLPGAA